jgi:hypothetical protein
VKEDRDSERERERVRERERERERERGARETERMDVGPNSKDSRPRDKIESSPSRA